MGIKPHQSKRKFFLKYSPSALLQARRLRREMTDVERKLWGLIRRDALGARFRRQVPFGPYVLDFFCVKAKLAIEVDGGSHFEGRGFARDMKRDFFLRNNGLTILRFSNRDVVQNPLAVLESIYQHLKTGVDFPSPRGEG